MSRNFSTNKNTGKSAPKQNLGVGFELSKHPSGPKKSLGQNFLEDKNIVNKIVASAGLTAMSTVLEIGPGKGSLTLLLAYHSKKVIAVEKDDTLSQELKITLKTLGIKNVEVINADILKELSEGGGGSLFKKLGHNYHVVANIPYYITGPLIRSLLEANPHPDEITLMVQKEVAQRICETPPRMSLLSVAVQYYASPKILFYVSKESFWPKPKVDSAVINLSPHRQHDSKAINFFKVVRAGFSFPRKQLLNNLSVSLKMEKEKIKTRLMEAGISPTQRAETLTIGDWEKLTTLLSL